MLCLNWTLERTKAGSKTGRRIYEDGPEAFEQTMQFRETMALLQHKSATPIRPFDAIKSLLESPPADGPL